MTEILGKYNFGCFGIIVNLDVLDEFANPNEVGLLMLKAMAQPPTKEHKDFILKQPNDYLKFHSIKLFSLYVHEGRHWSDISSTPFGYYINLQVLSFYLNSLTAKDYLISIPELKVPLIDNLMEELIPFEQSIRKNHELLKKIDSYLKQSAEINGNIVTSIEILEALAVLQQEHFIAEFLGKDCLNIFNQNTKSDSIYGHLISLLRSMGYTTVTIHILLYNSLFGFRDSPNLNIDISPPAILRKFLDVVKDNNDVGKKCNNCLITYQGYPNYVALKINYQSAISHVNNVKTQLLSDSNNNRIVQLLIEPLTEILSIGLSVFQLFESSPDSYKYPFTFYLKECWPILYFESMIGFTYPDSLNEFIKSYLGYNFDNIDKEIILSDIPFDLKSIMDTILYQLPDGKGKASNLFTINNPGKNYFKITDLFYEMIYVDILFTGGTILKPANRDRFIEVYVNSCGQKIILD